MNAIEFPFFAYGTLRPGEHNYNRVLSQVSGVEVRATIEGYEMYSGPGFPYVIKGEGTVVGDLIWVVGDYDDALARLDELEGYRGPGQPNHYTRELCCVSTHDGDRAQAWTYLASDRVELGARVDTGDWLAPAFAGTGGQS